MKKKIFITIFVIMAVFIYGAYRFYFSMSSLPGGKFLSEVASPSGEYTIKAYRTNGGATVAYAIRGELNFNNSGKKPKNIYWNYRENSATIEWIDNDTVMINGIELDVPNEKFDFRRE